MEFDSKMISIIGVVLAISLGYFIYLIYIDVLTLKSQVDDIKKSLTGFEESDEDSDEESELGEEYEYEDEDDFGDILDTIEEETEPEEIPEEPKLEELYPEEPYITPEEPSAQELTNTSVKPKKKRSPKKKQPIEVEQVVMDQCEDQILPIDI